MEVRYGFAERKISDLVLGLGFGVAAGV